MALRFLNAFWWSWKSSAAVEQPQAATATVFNSRRLRLAFQLGLLALTPAALWANSYTTNFGLTENPISEGGMWLTGLQTGLVWSPVQTSGGVASGIVDSNNGGNYNDPIAILTGTWGPVQTVQGTVYVNGTNNPQGEVELHVHFTLSANYAAGYEINAAVTGNGGGAGGNGYFVIVRWNGALGNFTPLAGSPSWNCEYPTIGVGCAGVSDIHVNNGDVVKATITSSGVISGYINGILIIQATDTTFTGGNPGMGMDGLVGTNTNWGFTSFTASDGSTTPPAAPKNLSPNVH